MNSNKQRKIFLINQSCGYLMIDIVNAFVFSGKYSEIVLATGEITPINTLLDKEVKVIKIATYNKTSAINRPLSWIIATFQVLFLLLFKYRNYELFLTSNPPSISFAMLFCRNEYSTLIYDVYPDGLVSSKVISEKNIIFILWSKMNKLFYRKSKIVFTITEGMVEIIAKYCNKSKIKVIPIWPSAGFDAKITKSENKFINNNDLKGKFIITYSGNLGKGHNLEVLIALAEKLQYEKEIIFVISGGGWAKENLVSLSKEKKLDNVLFFPRQNSDILAHSLSASDISFVSIEKELAKVCVPSKTYNLIKLEIPLLCVASKDSELYKIISNNCIGYCFEDNDIEDMSKYILQMKNDKIFYNEIVNNINFYSNSLTNNANSFVI